MPNLASFEGHVKLVLRTVQGYCIASLVALSARYFPAISSNSCNKQFYHFVFLKKTCSICLFIKYIYICKHGTRATINISMDVTINSTIDITMDITVRVLYEVLLLILQLSIFLAQKAEQSGFVPRNTSTTTSAFLPIHTDKHTDKHTDIHRYRQTHMNTDKRTYIYTAK